MKCNLLYINFTFFCYMHFTPNRNDIVPNDGTLLLTLNGSVNQGVIETKFLGVIIDDKLKWRHSSKGILHTSESYFKDIRQIQKNDEINTS